MIGFVYKGPLYKYDDPRACLLGAVKFIPEDEKLIARRIRVTTLSQGGFEKKKSYSELIKRNLATGNTPAIKEYAINRMMIDL